MKWFDSIMRKLGFTKAGSPSDNWATIQGLTDAQHRLIMMAEQTVDLSAAPDLHFGQLAQRFWDEGKREEALRCFNSAIELSRNDGPLYLNRANLKFQMGLFHEALADYEKAHQLMPDAPWELFGNEKMIQSLGPDSSTLKRLAARRAAQAEITRSGQSMN